ncbi:hypothetical protein TWF751_009305 [Orbilia oligospora]|nr:hypothetical protein TWF751_009305 [Orbilia oligospora]
MQAVPSRRHSPHCPFPSIWRPLADDPVESVRSYIRRDLRSTGRGFSPASDPHITLEWESLKLFPVPRTETNSLRRKALSKSPNEDISAPTQVDDSSDGITCF